MSKTEQARHKYRTPARGVALDMDGVIIDGMQFHIRAWTEAFNAFDIAISPIEIYKMEGIKSRDIVDIICTKTQTKLSDNAREEIVKIKHRVYKSLFRVVPIEGSKNLIKSLYSYGYALALVTGTLRIAAEKTLRKLQVIDFFSGIVSNETIGRGKPAPDPFQHSINILGVNPENCIVIENSPPGIASAKSAGLKCIAIATYLEEKFLAEADIVFENLQKCSKWFETEYDHSKGRGKWIL